MPTSRDRAVRNRAAHADFPPFERGGRPETAEEQESRVQAQMRRIRADPRWRGGQREGGLTADLAQEIRREHGKRYARATRSEKSLILNELTARYGLSRTMVRELLRGKTWR